MLSSSRPNNIPESDLCDAFGQFFLEKVVKLRGLVPELDQFDKSRSIMDKFQEVGVPEVTKVIQEGNSKSCSLDVLPTNLVKDMLPVLAGFLTELFNASLSSGIFSDSFKEVVVRPLLKKAGLDVNILINFRPLSNLSVIAVTQITKYLSENDLYMKYQSAYRAYHSTETTLLRVQNDVLCALNDRKDVVLVMLVVLV
ncbi:hypothetical protein SNE40_021168 [Patella caerulea]|uniref:Uncharacterized protein n=1 Tax=Patella caerulea TaxID=87958 RepID=A0AAN8J477_PATCE